MIRLYLTGLLSIWLVSHAFAQFESIQYDYEKNWFGQNQPLPAEKPWMITGELPTGIDMVEVSVYGSKNIKNEPLFTSNYRTPLEGVSKQFSIPMNYNLRGNSSYTLVLRYFSMASNDEVMRLAQMVSNSLDSYLSMSIVAGNNRVEMSKSPRMMKQDLDQIVNDGLSLYRNTLGMEFDGFSELITEKLERIDELKLRKAKFNILAKDKNEDADRAKRVAYFHENMTALQNMLKEEVRQYLSNNFHVLTISRKIENYKSEQTRWVLPVNLGYAAVYNKGDIDNLDDISWDGAPMVGISLPLANPYLAGKFWSNSSISAGLLTQNLDFGNNDDGEKIIMTGPIVDRPLYLAYGYKTAYFLRFNFGTTIMTEKGGNDRVKFNPFVGVSIELNLWLGLSR